MFRTGTFPSVEYVEANFFWKSWSIPPPPTYLNRVSLCLCLSLFKLLDVSYSPHLVCCLELLKSLDQQLSQSATVALNGKKSAASFLQLLYCFWCACFLLSLTVTHHSLSFWYDSCSSRGITRLLVIWLSWMRCHLSRTETCGIWQLFLLWSGTVASPIILSLHSQCSCPLLPQ